MTRHASRIACAAIALLLCGCGARGPTPLCILDPAAMPESWRPIGEKHKRLSAAPWSDAEARAAAMAVERGLAELTALYSSRPETINALGTNVVESLIDVTYAAGNMPALRDAAADQARQALTRLTDRFVARAGDWATCEEFSELIPYANYANRLLPPNDPLIRKLVKLANAALRECGSLKAAMGRDYRETLSKPDAPLNGIWDLTVWSIRFTDAELLPDIELPVEARELAPALWRYLATYPFHNASDYPERALNTAFNNTAYLVTHIAYIPTGYGRHPIYVADMPRLHNFLRENFYAVLEQSELDLIAEFVDLFRQYGCTEKNDLQLRDGTRYLLRLFHSAGDSWMNYREPWQGHSVSGYEAIHKPWTGMAGVRVRVPEPAAPGTYGGVVRQWLGQPR